MWHSLITFFIVIEAEEGTHKADPSKWLGQFDRLNRWVVGVRKQTRRKMTLADSPAIIIFEGKRKLRICFSAAAAC